MTNEEMVALVKGIIDTNVGGLMTKKQLDKFITTAVDQSAFLKTIRVETGIAVTMELDRLGLSTRLLRKKIEATELDSGDKATATRGYETITLVKNILHVPLTYEWIQKAIGGSPDINPDAVAAVEAMVHDLIAKQYANDLADLSWNGDTAETGDSFLKIMDGYIKKFKAHGSTNKVTSWSSADKIAELFQAMLTEMPDKWKADRARLRFYVAPSVEDTYRNELGERNTALGDLLIVKNEPIYYKGIKIEALPYMPATEATLTFPENFAIGFGSQMLVERDKDIKAQVIDVVTTSDVGVACVIPDAIVQATQS